MLLSSYWVYYYIKNIQQKDLSNEIPIITNDEMIMEISNELKEDYKSLEEEITFYNNTNDYIKQERKLIAMIKETIVNEKTYKMREKVIIDEEIKHKFTANDISEIKKIIQETIS